MLKVPKLTVYMMPGLGASSQIFERISLPESAFDVVLLEWIEPLPSESLQAYASRMAQQIDATHAVLLGVSFGGILVQEMAAYLPHVGLVIVSSIKCRSEMPTRLRLISRYKLYRIAPVKWVDKMFILQKWPLPRTIKKRLDLYEIYMNQRSSNYLNWAIREVVNWSRTTCDPKVIHLHGDQDAVFTSQMLKNYVKVPNGTHVMILFKYHWFNKYLPQYLQEAYLKAN